MEYNRPPHAADICADCPSPQLVARPKDHFGKSCWEFECEYAEEVSPASKGITIHCAQTGQPCSIDNGIDYFVSSPRISLMKNFFEATMKFLDR